MERTYIAIDLKSFYASVECIERGLDPMNANLVVADPSRTEKTICLAVTPALKAWGIPGRARLFEVVEAVRGINAARRKSVGKLTEKCISASALRRDPRLELDYLVAPPRMALYMDYSTRIYRIYLRFVAPEDIHVYSIDEVFIDATRYLPMYGLTAQQLARRMIRTVLQETGITATAGIGPNLFLCKVAMDITAKHIPADKEGVRIAELDLPTYRRTMWDHKPLTDFWRVGKGYATKLAQYGMYTMGDVVRCSVENEELLYRLFGVNAELLIDHAWGWEPCTLDLIKAYRPSTNSVSSGQVLQNPYDFEKARLVMREMVDLLVLDLVEKGLVTDQIVLTVGYDIENLTDPGRRARYKGAVTTDAYGRKIPKHAHGTANLPMHCSSTRIILEAATALFDRIVDRDLLTRRITVAACRVLPESQAPKPKEQLQLDLFTDYEALERQKKQEQAQLAREKKRQKALLDIKKKYGKNAIMKGMNLEEGATAKERNAQIGGHKA